MTTDRCSPRRKKPAGGSINSAWCASLFPFADYRMRMASGLEILPAQPLACRLSREYLARRHKKSVSLWNRMEAARFFESIGSSPSPVSLMERRLGP